MSRTRSAPARACAKASVETIVEKARGGSRTDRLGTRFTRDETGGSDDSELEYDLGQEGGHASAASCTPRT